MSATRKDPSFPRSPWQSWESLLWRQHDAAAAPPQPVLAQKPHRFVLKSSIQSQNALSKTNVNKASYGCSWHGWALNKSTLLVHCRNILGYTRCMKNVRISNSKANAARTLSRYSSSTWYVRQLNSLQSQRNSWAIPKEGSISLPQGLWRNSLSVWAALQFLMLKAYEVALTFWGAAFHRQALAYATPKCSLGTLTKLTKLTKWTGEQL